MYRLRELWPDYSGRLRIAWRTLALEVKNEKPTPKFILDQENPVMAELDPRLPIGDWRAPEWQYPATILPAFEAIECAVRQGDRTGWEFSWRVRHAFFAESRCISMRHVLLELARESGLDVEQFRSDWDSGSARPVVLADSHRGWDELKVLCSPTFVLPSGLQLPNPAAAKATWGKGARLLNVEPYDGDWRDAYREFLEAACTS